WDIATAKVRGQLPAPERMNVMRFSPDGKTLLLQFLGHSAQLWDVASARPRSAPLYHPGAGIQDMAFSRDGRAVATAGSDRTAIVWDVATSKPLGPPLPHPAAVAVVAFTADGRQLITGCDDGS